MTSTPLHLDVAPPSTCLEDHAAALDAVLAGAGPDIAAQPIVDLHRGVAVGFEALARFGGVAPDVFFAIADDLGLGLGAELNAHVLGRATDNARILAAVAAHASKDHGVTPDDALVAAVTANIRDAA